MSEDFKSTRAYALFCGELGKTLAHAEIAFAGVPEVEALKQLVFGFHNIKGTAGFFGLSAVAEKAAAIEKILKAKQALTAPDLAELQGLVAAIRGLTAAL